MKTLQASLLAVLALSFIHGCERADSEARFVGITADSDYLLFVVDSSGSMRRYEWDRVMEMMRDTLAMYPAAAGLQVISDAGVELIADFRDAWIPNTPENQQRIIEALTDWEAFSTSNPSRGLLSAFDRYDDHEKAMAVFLLSDDFAAGDAAIDGVVAEVDARNRERAADLPRIRIHSVAFPVYYDVLGRDQFLSSTGADLVELTSMLSQRNDGRFLGLPSRHVDRAEPAAIGAEDASAAGANRVLIFVDTSANMREPYWQRAVDTTAWLLDDPGEGKSFQIMALTTPATSIVAGSEGQWLDNADGSLGERVEASLRDMTPAGAVDLGAVASVVGGLDPSPDQVYVLTASDPAIFGRNVPQVEFPNSGDAPVDILLFGAGDAPQAVPFYWTLALEGGGSLVAPAEDWP